MTRAAEKRWVCAWCRKCLGSPNEAEAHISNKHRGKGFITYDNADAAVRKKRRKK